MSRFSSVFERLAVVANSLQRLLNAVLLITGSAIVVLMFSLYSVDASWWWNLIKCSVVAIPWLVWGGVWLIFEQLKNSPETARQVLSDKDDIVQHLSATSRKDLTSIRGAFGFLNTLRKQEGYEGVLDIVGGVSMLINPLFWLLALISFIALLILTFSAFLLLLF